MGCQCPGSDVLSRIHAARKSLVVPIDAGLFGKGVVAAFPGKSAAQLTCNVGGVPRRSDKLPKDVDVAACCILEAQGRRRAAHFIQFSLFFNQTNPIYSYTIFNG